MCECKERFEEALVERAKKRQPEATGVRAALGGYGLNFTTGEMRPALTATVTFQAPKAKGGLKTVSERISAVASFCPFCGERFKVPDA
jgi:hypothetical protein